MDEITIKVVGVGCGGCAVLDRLAGQGARGVTCIAVNTDSQALHRSQAAVKVHIGDKLTEGLGAGGDPIIGQCAAEESYEELRDALQGADMIFIAAGMGGGTGTGAAPVIASIAQDLGALTVGVITKPFTFEGNRRRRIAEEGTPAFEEKVNTLITVPNDRLLSLADKKMTMMPVVALAPEVLCTGIRGICDPITVPGLINLDFADVKSVMSAAGAAGLAIGRADGASRAIDAARQAIQSPWLDISIEDAGSVLLSIAGSDYTLFEVHEAAAIVQEAADPDANIIFGAVIDETLGDMLRVTLLVTGFRSHPGRWRQEWRPSGNPPWSGGPPPSEQRIPRRPHPSAHGGAAAAIPPDTVMPDVDAVGTIAVPWSPPDEPGGEG